MKLAIIALMAANVAVSAEVLNFDLPPELKGAEIAGYIFDANPEVVQISKVSSDQAAELYASLEKGYEHFLYVPISHLFIASKNILEVVPIKSRGNDDRSGGSIEGGISGKWGDGDGVHWEGYARAEAHDNNGNYAEAEVKQKDNGRGEVNVRGGHESDKK